MKSLLAFVQLGLVFLAVVGCGPLQAPMAPRPDAEAQKEIDEAWDRVLGPVDHLDHQALLDVLMFTKAYEVGVDRLTFRSEKQVTAGTVVMEVHYDRLKPAEDRFEVQLVDMAGGVLRKERYGRDEVERTYKELFVEGEQLRHKGGPTPEEARKLAQYEARLKAIQEIFPKADQAKKEG